MCRGSRVAEKIGPSTRWAVVEALKRFGVATLTDVRYERIEDGAVVIREGEGAEREIPAERWSSPPARSRTPRWRPRSSPQAGPMW
jgi:hypothetical protein